jgi:hypothetical protein
MDSPNKALLNVFMPLEVELQGHEEKTLNFIRKNKDGLFLHSYQQCMRISVAPRLHPQLVFLLFAILRST